MKTSSLRRTGLLLAVAGCLSRPATAQTDAAFSSELGKVDAALARMAQLKTESQKPAMPETTSVAAAWRKVTETTHKDGKYSEGTNGWSSYSIEDVAGNLKAEHTVHNIRVFGPSGQDKRIGVEGAALIVVRKKLGDGRWHWDTTEKLEAKEGCWHADQWTFEVDAQGRMKSAKHVRAVEASGGKIVFTYDLDPSDPEIKTQFDAAFNYWAERKL